MNDHVKDDYGESFLSAFFKNLLFESNLEKRVKKVGERFGGESGCVYLCAPLLKRGRVSSLSL